MPIKVRETKEGCFLSFYNQPWTSHNPAEASWVKQLKAIKMTLNIICML